MMPGLGDSPAPSLQVENQPQSSRGGKLRKIPAVVPKYSSLTLSKTVIRMSDDVISVGQPPEDEVKMSSSNAEVFINQSDQLKLKQKVHAPQKSSQNMLAVQETKSKPEPIRTLNRPTVSPPPKKTLPDPLSPGALSLHYWRQASRFLTPALKSLKYSQQSLSTSAPSLNRHSVNPRSLTSPQRPVTPSTHPLKRSGSMTTAQSLKHSSSMESQTSSTRSLNSSGHPLSRTSSLRSQKSTPNYMAPKRNSSVMPPIKNCVKPKLKPHPLPISSKQPSQQPFVPSVNVCVFCLVYYCVQHFCVSF